MDGSDAAQGPVYFAPGRNGASTCHRYGETCIGCRKYRRPRLLPEHRNQASPSRHAEHDEKGNSWASRNAMLTCLISRSLSYVPLHGASRGRTRTPE